MSQAKKYVLFKPLDVGNIKITELNFRDYATAEDLLAFDEHGPNKQTIALIASLTGSDAGLIKRLHIKDFRACDAIASDLISDHVSDDIDENEKKD